MKNRYVIMATVLLASINTFAQKDQIKAAEKALKNGNSAEAKTILKDAEPLTANASDSEKAQYLFVKGNVLADLSKKNVEVLSNELEAAKAYQDLLALEKKSGSSKYSSQAQTAITEIKGNLINGAIDSGNKKNYADAAKQLKAAYDLDKTDLDKLYYAASYAINGKDYPTALGFYQELKDKNFTGEGTTYFATNKETKKEDSFNTKNERDLYVKAGSHEKPRDEKSASKKGEIYKNIALILANENKNEEAKKAFDDARIANPDDTSLITTQADFYYKLNDLVMYKKLINEALEKSPNDPVLLYNLGVVSSKANQNEDAEKYFLKAIQLKQDYADAYLNLSELKLRGDADFVKEMNKLGTSDSDTKKYNVLKANREKMFRDTLPYLEKAYQLDPKNDAVSSTLLSVYRALDMNDKVKELKAKM